MDERGRLAWVGAWLGESLHRRLLLAGVALTLGFTTLVGIASYVVSERLVRQSVDERLGADADLAAGAIAHELREAYGDIESLSGSALLKNALLDSEDRDRYVTPFLHEFRSSVLTTVRIALCDYRGRVLTAPAETQPSIEDRAWLEEVMEGAQVHSAMHVHPSPHLFLAFPVKLDPGGQPEGALVAEIELSPLLREAAVSAPRSSARRLVWGAGEFVEGERDGWDGRIVRRRPLLLPAPLERLALAIDAGLPRETAARPLRILAIAHLAAVALVLALTVVAARILAQRLARPVRVLAEAADRVTGGAALGTRVPALGRDEVGRLGAAFNAMLDRVEAATAAEQAREATGRRRAERALQLALAAIERAWEAIAILTPDGAINFVNEAWKHMVGADCKDCAGRRVWELAPALDEAGWRRDWDAVKESGSLIRELRVPGPAGAPTWIEMAVSRLAFEGGEYGIVAIRDVSGRKQAEAVERLASIGTLAAGTAHEINNPVAFVSGNLSFIEAELAARAAGSPDAAPIEEVLAAVREAREGADRVREIAHALRTFARRDDADTFAAVEVPRSLKAALVIARGEIKQRARLVTHLDERVPHVLAPGHRLEQVWLNLIVNAAQAIESGNPEENEIAVAAFARGHEVVVEVRDTGCGIPPEVKAQIFEPFFTTKVAGAGTGLGLSLCHGIVASVGGRIEVESEPGRGTTFRVVLPAARQDALAHATSPPPLAAAPALCEPVADRLRAS